MTSTMHTTRLTGSKNHHHTDFYVTSSGLTHTRISDMKMKQGRITQLVLVEQVDRVSCTTRLEVVLTYLRTYSYSPILCKVRDAKV